MSTPQHGNAASPQPRPTAGELVVAHLAGMDTAELLDRADCRELADELASSMAGMIARHGGTPDAFAAMLAADRARRAIAAAN